MNNSDILIKSKNGEIFKKLIRFYYYQRLVIIRFILFLILLHFSNVVISQIVFSGKITNSTGQAIASASVTLKDSSGKILAFNISNQLGYYNIQWKSPQIKEVYFLEAASVGYAKKYIYVDLVSGVFNLTLTESLTRLPDVKVATTIPIRKEGDTLNYDVKTFSASEDRVIGDVIKRLPGIEVAENGQISFAGKPINRFYIDGDNILDGRYNVATQSIPNDIISKVQILQEHQPLKILKGFEKSDQAALNIVTNQKIRGRVVTTGDASIGLPEVYALSANLMLFKRKIKYINYLKFNNIGIDNADDFLNHFATSESSPISLLNAGIASPDIPKRRYIFNNTGTVTLNDMITLKNDFQFRLNLFYNWDQLSQNSINSTINYLPTDTIRYLESQRSISKINSVTTQLTLTANKQNYFLNEELNFERTPNDIHSAVLQNSGSKVGQHLSGHITSVSNKIAILKKTKSGLILEGRSNINYTNNPSTLFVEPGVYQDFISSSQPYVALEQHAFLPSLFTDNYISTGLASTNFQQRYKVGFSYQSQELNSDLVTIEASQMKHVLTDSFLNNVNWNRLKTYFKSDFTFTGNRIVFAVSFPVSFQRTNYSQKNIIKEMPNLLFEPKINLIYIVGKDANINFSYGYENIFGGINQAYTGFIMRNYKSFYSNDSILNNSKKHSSSLIYSYKNILHILFLQFGCTVSQSENNTIKENFLNSLFQREKVTFLLNYTNSVDLYTKISKYYTKIQSTFTGRVSWQSSKSNQFQNGILLPVLNNSRQYSLSINSKVIPKTSIDYTATFLNAISKIQSSQGNNIAIPRTTRWQHRLSTSFTISEKTYIKANAEYASYLVTSENSNKSSYFFSDASWVYKINKWHSDLELGVTNFTNSSNYRTVYLVQNTLTENVFLLRPRMIIGKITFRF